MSEKDLNFNANNHPCTSCEYGGVWKENGVPCGNLCKHNEIIDKIGWRYGRYHSYKSVPSWCPKKKGVLY